MQGTLGSLDSLKGVPLHLALEYTGVGLVACDGSGMMTLISPTLQDCSTWSTTPALRAVLRRTFHLFRSDGETTLPTDEMPLVQARRGEFVRDALVTTRRSDGTLVHLKCNAVPLRDDDGADIGAILAGPGRHGGDGGRAAREELERRLLETINHEFRTPLAALLAHVELIHDHRDRRDDLDPELAGWLDAIERAGWRLRDLVEQVAELVNREPHAQPVDRRPRSVRAS